MSPNPSPEASRKLGYGNVPAPKISASSHLLCDRPNHNLYIHLLLNMGEIEILQRWIPVFKNLNSCSITFFTYRHRFSHVRRFCENRSLQRLEDASSQLSTLQKASYLELSW